ncbi:MAG TPA: monofunctional biosynthetic peptidoglycan transglycosylase [Bacteroidota bacterium]|nr:monofunctional biosynthetic peptidoglycan transglycosylase [Bacteroidota bacterium]
MNFKDTKATVLAWIRAHKMKTAAYAVLALVLSQYVMLPNNSLQDLRKENPGRTALMRQRESEAEAEGKPFSIQQQWVPISRISPHLVHAVITSEDGTFYEHAGIDWYELEESIEKNIEKGKPARGGSTITQQLSKNLFFSTSKSYGRKAKELIVALRMERQLSKKRILEIYLNIIEWGPGIFGAEAASRRYFGKPASQLSREEAACLAAVIPSPLKHAPNAGSAYVARRSSLILYRMASRGY